MSIINDALKKTQEKLKQAADGTNSTAPTQPVKKTLATIEQEEKDRQQREAHQKPAAPSASQTAAKPASSFSKATLLLFVLLICAGILAYICYPQYKSKIPNIKRMFAKFFHHQNSGLSSIQLETKKQLPKIVSLSASKPAIGQVSMSQSPTSVQTTLPTASNNSTQTTKIPGLVLKGILKQDNKNTALINDSVYEEGSTVLERKILKIESDRVELSDNGKVEILTINP